MKWRVAAVGTVILLGAAAPVPALLVDGDDGDCGSPAASFFFLLAPKQPWFSPECVAPARDGPPPLPPPDHDGCEPGGCLS